VRRHGTRRPPLACASIVFFHTMNDSFIIIINGVINYAIKENIDIDISLYDTAKCFDAMWYQETMNDMWDVGVKDDKFALYIYIYPTKSYQYYRLTILRIICCNTVTSGAEQGHQQMEKIETIETLFIF
jgi:hypothetical protein